MAQLVLNGKIDPKLSYHTMFATRETQSQLQRFTIQCNREKLWVCSSSQTSAPALGSVASTNYSNIGRYLAHNVAALLCQPCTCRLRGMSLCKALRGSISSCLIAPGLSGTRPSTSRRNNFSELHRLVMGAGLSISGELANSGLHSLVMGTGYG